MRFFPNILKRKLATTVLIGASIAAFATLGDGGKKKITRSKDTFSTQLFIGNFKTFSLKPDHNYRGTSIFNLPKSNDKFIMLNTVVTYQRGNTTYILPLKKKLFLDKVSFHIERP